MSNHFEEIHIDQLIPHPQNVRKSLGNVVDMANSITAQGIIQPLTVTQHPEKEGDFLIIAGHQRRAAAALANLDVLPCIVDPSLDTLEKQLLAMLAENTHRNDLTPVEESAGYQQVFDLGVPVKLLAQKAGRSQSHIRKRLLLNKLPEEAKVKLEDRTLNIDQGLVLVDFADNEEATGNLLAAAASGRDWSFTVAQEVRKRDAPGQVKALEAELKEAGAKFVPDSQLYTHWNRVVEREGEELTIVEHVAAGHGASLNRAWARLDWYEKPERMKTPKPELSEEELEAKRRDAALSAALDIAHAVRAEHLKAVIKSPPEGAADEALYALLLDGLYAHTTLYSEITGRRANAEDGYAEIKAALLDFTTGQMALLLHLSTKSYEDQLLKLDSWDVGSYANAYGPKKWLESLGTIYHYEFSSVEQEVLDHFTEARAARLLENGTEDQEDEDYDDE
ncbi:ParB/RepB/Spo0J family partition protein [Pseudarthrobacter sp. HLT3-5]|uniref:ParB/RepB/Spo0J family partition protein n=1 Tax=Pseudarthrobacter cellobiosi TaxID=2953654 RepID=UPI00208E4810|nr:ParB/RepB/Spo0J family partition protein [Pseudarthrobacter sp. HLT3-5]MCO4276109.1 ParB/RepB/Spo0J family partition protein [Pseudarthrobacter sp. HLT3-5]